MSHTPSYADNGYTTGFYDGKQAEQKRIIKLLEERSKCGHEHDYNGSCYCEEIALIRNLFVGVSETQHKETL